MATLPGIKFYEASGYRAEEPVALSVGDGVAIDLLPMRKELS
jgi:hypothetical protein